jgi:flagellar biosynthesis/type III secretory pathway protein FliH
MKIGFGRVRDAATLDGDTATTARDGVQRPRAEARPARLARVLSPEIVVAASQARKAVEQAQAQADALLAAARDEAEALRARAAEEGRADGAAALAQRVLALAVKERQMEDRALDRLVDLARVLAERLLGEALRVDPSRVTALAKQALAEAQGARRIEIAAHPDDVPLLERELASADADTVVRVVADPSRGRGALRFETDLGTLDAELAPQLDRLARKLRAVLDHD